VVNRENRVIVLLVVIDLLMLGFSVTAVVLGEGTVAAIAGSGFVALSNQIARGLLSRRGSGRRV
jgi:uncharacterized membrane protein